MAPPPNTPSDKPLTLHARYQAPPSPVTDTNTDRNASASASAPQHHLFTHPLPSSLSLNRGTGTGTGTGTDSPANRTAYLSDLRATVSTMQDEINVFLTARMEEDNRRLAAQGKGAGGRNGGYGGRDAREEREEENYGEEVVDDE